MNTQHRTSVPAVLLVLAAALGLSCQAEDDDTPVYSPPADGGVPCGDQVAEGDEVCDGTDLRGQDCASVDPRYTSGDLLCLSDCSGFDVAGCVQPEPATFSNPFTVDIDGSGSDRLGLIHLSVGSGDVAVHDTADPEATLSTLAYEMTDWTEFGYVLFHLVAPQPDRLHVMYLYCAEEDLPWAWHESYDSPMASENSSGTCAYTTQPAEFEPDLAELTGLPSSAELVDGFSVTGADVDFQGEVGLLRMAGVDYELYPFQVVDCTGTACAADPADGWWELHSMLSDGSRICFGILYLMVSDPNSIVVGYPICFDPVERADDFVLPANWTAPPPQTAAPPPNGYRPKPLPGLDKVLWPRPRILPRSRVRR